MISRQNGAWQCGLSSLRLHDKFPPGLRIFHTVLLQLDCVRRSASSPPLRFDRRKPFRISERPPIQAISYNRDSAASPSQLKRQPAAPLSPGCRSHCARSPCATEAQCAVPACSLAHVLTRRPYCGRCLDVWLCLCRGCASAGLGSGPCRPRHLGHLHWRSPA